MPSLTRLLSFLGVPIALVYAGMFALVSLVDPTPREFVVTIPQESMAKRVAVPATAKRTTGNELGDRLQGVEPDRLAGVLEKLHISR